MEGQNRLVFPNVYQVGVSPVRFRMYPECRFLETDLVGPMLLRVTAAMSETDLIDPPEFRPADWSTNRGCCLKTDLQDEQRLITCTNVA